MCVSSPCVTVLTQTQRPEHAMKLTRSSVLFISSANLGAVTGATGLAKRELLSLPDPLAVVVIDGEQACSTSVARRTLSPVWNESFDL